MRMRSKEDFKLVVSVIPKNSVAAGTYSVAAGQIVKQHVKKYRENTVKEKPSPS
ncbi:MAG: hypothetical protein ACJAXE_000456 [Neolewinella sp.]|jgi:hypothetical protein